MHTSFPSVVPASQFWCFSLPHVIVIWISSGFDLLASQNKQPCTYFCTFWHFIDQLDRLTHEDNNWQKSASLHCINPSSAYRKNKQFSLCLLLSVHQEADLDHFDSTDISVCQIKEEVLWKGSLRGACWEEEECVHVTWGDIPHVNTIWNPVIKNICFGHLYKIKPIIYKVHMNVKLIHKANTDIDGHTCIFKSNKWQVILRWKCHLNSI